MYADHYFIDEMSYKLKTANPFPIFIGTGSCRSAQTRGRLGRNMDTNTDEMRKAAANKNYMSIAVSQIARNNGGAARQESNPQSATASICRTLAVIIKANQ